MIFIFHFGLHILLFHALFFEIGNKMGALLPLDINILLNCAGCSTLLYLFLPAVV